MVSEGDSIADNTEKGKITIAGGNKNIGMLSEHYEEKEQPASLKPVSKNLEKVI